MQSNFVSINSNSGVQLKINTTIPITYTIDQFYVSEVETCNTNSAWFPETEYLKRYQSFIWKRRLTCLQQSTLLSFVNCFIFLYDLVPPFAICQILSDIACRLFPCVNSPEVCMYNVKTIANYTRSAISYSITCK